MSEYNSEYDVQLGILESIGGDTTKRYDAPIEVQKAILDHIEGGGGGVPEAPVDGKYYARKDGDWAEIDVENLKIIAVDELPVASQETMGAIYLVPKEGSESDVKNEYITLENDGEYSWELIGNTAIDLSGYYTKDETDELLDEKPDYTEVYLIDEVDNLLGDKQDKLTAGEGISIEDNVISADGGGSAEAITYVNELPTPSEETVGNLYRINVPIPEEGEEMYDNDRNYMLNQVDDESLVGVAYMCYPNYNKFEYYTGEEWSIVRSDGSGTPIKCYLWKPLDETETHYYQFSIKRANEYFSDDEENFVINVYYSRPSSIDTENHIYYSDTVYNNQRNTLLSLNQLKSKSDFYGIYFNKRWDLLYKRNDVLTTYKDVKNNVIGGDSVFEFDKTEHTGAYVSYNESAYQWAYCPIRWKFITSDNREVYGYLWTVANITDLKTSIVNRTIIYSSKPYFDEETEKFIDRNDVVFMYDNFITNPNDIDLDTHTIITPKSYSEMKTLRKFDNMISDRKIFCNVDYEVSYEDVYRWGKLDKDQLKYFSINDILTVSDDGELKLKYINITNDTLILQKAATFSNGNGFNGNTGMIISGGGAYCTQDSLCVGWYSRTEKGGQIAIGANKTGQDYVLMVGNGTNSSNRSNAFDVDKYGNTTQQGTSTATEFVNTSSQKAVVADSPNTQIKIWTGTEDEYEAIVTKDAHTLYIMTD